MMRELERYDVVVIGGAFAGGSLATLLARWRPSTKILVVERSERFSRKVGEATVEVSALFLMRVLKLYDVLAREHLPKHGLRFWFSSGPDASLSDMSEVGMVLAPVLQTWQLDRSRIDETLLGLAVREGVELERPAKVIDVRLDGLSNRVVIETPKGTREVEARWVVDASGRQAFLARRMGLYEKNERHPTSAYWARFKGVADMDGVEIQGSDPGMNRLPQLKCSRRLATNHFCGHGWWCWVIPLAGGETSIGVVFDKRMYQLPKGGSSRERFETFVHTQPGLRELVRNAEIDGDDFQSYEHLPYKSKRYAGLGWALVGDAASFIDPYYSPGLDHASFSAYATARLILRELGGEIEGAKLTAEIDRHDRRFQKSYERWFEAVYRDKYELLGDAELTAVAYYLDTASYYLGVAGQAYRKEWTFAEPVLGIDHPLALLAHRFMRFYQKRLVRIARNRQARGTYGRLNHAWRCYGRNFGDGARKLTGSHRKGLRLWMQVELRELAERLHLVALRPSSREPALAATAREESV
jgi:flavin-dependent dehydrogenase